MSKGVSTTQDTDPLSHLDLRKLICQNGVLGGKHIEKEFVSHLWMDRLLRHQDVYPGLPRQGQIEWDARRLALGVAFRRVEADRRHRVGHDVVLLVLPTGVPVGSLQQPRV